MWIRSPHTTCSICFSDMLAHSIFMLENWIINDNRDNLSLSEMLINGFLSIIVILPHIYLNLPCRHLYYESLARKWIHGEHFSWKYNIYYMQQLIFGHGYICLNSISFTQLSELTNKKQCYCHTERSQFF